jgi:hypothetical protein
MSSRRRRQPSPRARRERTCAVCHEPLVTREATRTRAGRAVHAACVQPAPGAAAPQRPPRLRCAICGDPIAAGTGYLRETETTVAHVFCPPAQGRRAARAAAGRGRSARRRAQSS